MAAQNYLRACLALILLGAPVQAAADNQSQGSTDGSCRNAGGAKKRDGLSFSAGPTEGTGLGFGVSLKGYNEIRSHWDISPALAAEPYLGYESNSNLNSVSNSLNQISLEVKPGIIFGVSPDASGAPDASTNNASNSNASTEQPPPPPVTTDCSTGLQTSPVPPPPGPQSPIIFGLYGDFKYRYGTFDRGSRTSDLNQFLGGGGAYLVWAKDQMPEWVAFWPRLSATYYAPISTSSGVTTADLPPGVKANYLQLDLTAGIAFGKGMFGATNYNPFRLTFSYKGSEPTVGSDTQWENMADLQLSTNLLGKTFKPAITFQAGRNGGLQYDKQVLLGIMTDEL
jgi:hypothetical protein